MRFLYAVSHAPISGRKIHRRKFKRETTVVSENDHVNSTENRLATAFAPPPNVWVQIPTVSHHYALSPTLEVVAGI